MKKALNVLYVILAAIGGLWVSMQTLLWVVLPWQPVQDFLKQEISRVAARPVTFERVSARLTGLDLRGVEISAGNSSVEKQGTLLSARGVFLRWSLWQLLRGRILVKAVMIEQPHVDIVRYADGSFNFDGLFGSQEQASVSEEKEEDKAFSLDLNVRHLRVTDGHIIFTDEQAEQKAEIEDLFFSVEDFSFDGRFPLSLNATLAYATAQWPRQTAEVGLTAWPDLKQMDLAAASAELTRLVLKHDGGVFVLRGEAKNFENPEISLHLNMRQVTDKLVRFASADIPAFELDEADIRINAAADLAAQRVNVSSLQAGARSAVVYSSSTASEVQLALPEASVYLSAAADWGRSRAEISSFTITGLKSFVSSSGTVAWAGKPDFNVSGAFSADLRAAAEAVPMLQPYQPRGTVYGTAEGSPSTASADVKLQSVGATVPYAGTLADFNMRAVLKDLKHLRIPSFSGRLNEGEFNGAVELLYDGKNVDAEVSFHSPRLALPALEQEASSQMQDVQTQASSQTAGGFVLPPVNLKAQASIDSLDAPYLWGEDIVFSADLQNLTSTLENAHGELSLNTGQGEIKDLNKLTNANLFTKVMFGSLSAVSKVINSLNVFAVLNGLGSGVLSAVTNEKEKPADMVVQTVKDAEGNDVQILVPYTEQKVDGRLAFELFSTDVTFTNGAAEVEKGSFVSDLMSFNLTGDMNFKTQELDLKVNAAPGRHYEDGIMPLTLTVGGTLDNPQGSMSMASSVTSLVTQGMGNNFVSRSVKKGLGGFLGLFKKKDKKEAVKDEAENLSAEETTLADEANAPQETDFAQQSQTPENTPEDLSLK